MHAIRLLTKLVIHYAVVTAVLVLAFWLYPGVGDYLPIGRVQTLIAQADGIGSAANGLQQLMAPAAAPAAHMTTLGGSIIWLLAAVAGALLAALPVSWVYMEVRNHEDYDQSLVDTIVVLPLVVTAIVVVVQNSLALSFSLAGIAGAARYRNSLKSSGDLLFILLAIGIGLAVGIGALELALVTSAAFNLCFLLLWTTDYGERANMKRFLDDFDHPHEEPTSATVTTTTASSVVTEVTETFQLPPEKPKP